MEKTDNKIDSVVLKPINMQIYKNVNYEPQYVTTRSINSANLYIESSDCTLELKKENILISTIKTLGDSAATLFTNICRVQLRDFTMYNVTPPVNNRNNTVRFFSTFSNIFHTVIIPESFYNDPNENETNVVAMIDALLLALNNEVTSGLTFSATSDEDNFPRIYELTAVGGEFYFDKNCDCVRKGKYTYNLPSDDIPSFTKIIGPISYSYTSYIDICSQTLTKYSKLQNSSTGYNSNIICRVYDDVTIPNHNNQPYFFAFGVPEEISFNYNPIDSISVIDIQIKDQWGELYYVPEKYRSIFNWGIILRFEV